MSLVNFTWGIGAVACPLLILLALRVHHLAVFLWMVTAASGAVAAVVFLLPWNRQSGAEENAGAKDEEARKIPHVGIILAALFFIYVGAEMETVRVGGGAGEARVQQERERSYTIVPMFFYVGLADRAGAGAVWRCTARARK